MKNAAELDLSQFAGVEEVGVASGLSTPPDLVEAVVARLYGAALSANGMDQDLEAGNGG